MQIDHLFVISPLGAEFIIGAFGPNMMIEPAELFQEF